MIEGRRAFALAIDEHRIVPDPAGWDRRHSPCLASSADITGRDADAVLRAVFETMSQALEQGDRIELRRFSTFSLRQGRNPQTGEVVVAVDAKTVVDFKAGKHLLQILNGDPDAIAAFRAKQEGQRR